MHDTSASSWTPNSAGTPLITRADILEATPCHAIASKQRLPLRRQNRGRNTGRPTSKGTIPTPGTTAVAKARFLRLEPQLQRRHDSYSWNYSCSEGTIPTPGTTAAAKARFLLLELQL
ncbi:uncharacterized protein [Penaeus vannamei]|uniref:uncharacterized protein n=1 Tax=Penaeus vannamei TaxID=6689 RepID=UPI00387F3D5F